MIEQLNERPRVELCVREQAPGGARDRQRSVYDRLQTLDREDAIERFTVTTWSKTVALSDDGGIPAVGEQARTKYDEFEEWATRRGYDLTPAFDRRSHSPMLAAPYEEIVFPVVCVAVSEGDQLRAVYPHSEGETVHTVEDGLDVLEARTESTGNVTETRPSGQTSVENADRTPARTVD